MPMQSTVSSRNVTLKFWEDENGETLQALHSLSP
jgi:hypothetical protein